MNKILAIDLDGVIYGFWECYRDYLMTKGIELNFSIPHKFDFYHDWGLTSEQFMIHFQNGINEKFIFAKGDPIDECVKYINKLKSDGYIIHIITNREIPGTELNYSLNTELWLEFHKIRYDTITYAKDKGIIAKNFSVDIFIEDNIYNCYEILEKKGCRKILLYDQPWNKGQEYPNVHRVYNWKDIYETVSNL